MSDSDITCASRVKLCDLFAGMKVIQIMNDQEPGSECDECALHPMPTENIWINTATPLALHSYPNTGLHHLHWGLLVHGLRLHSALVTEGDVVFVESLRRRNCLSFFLNEIWNITPNWQGFRLFLFNPWFQYIYIYVYANSFGRLVELSIE